MDSGDEGKARLSRRSLVVTLAIGGLTLVSAIFADILAAFASPSFQGSDFKFVVALLLLLATALPTMVRPILPAYTLPLLVLLGALSSIYTSVLSELLLTFFDERRTMAILVFGASTLVLAAVGSRESLRVLRFLRLARDRTLDNLTVQSIKSLRVWFPLVLLLLLMIVRGRLSLVARYLRYFISKHALKLLNVLIAAAIYLTLRPPQFQLVEMVLLGLLVVLRLAVALSRVEVVERTELTSDELRRLSYIDDGLFEQEAERILRERPAYRWRKG